MKAAFEIAYKIILLLMIASITSWPFIEMEESDSSPQGFSVQSLYGTNYAWADSIAISTTAVDSHFTTSWYQVTIWSPDADIEIRIGTPDTTSWSSRKWLELAQGQTLSFGNATKLTRMECRTASGTGTLAMAGYKTVAQY